MIVRGITVGSLIPGPVHGVLVEDRTLTPVRGSWISIGGNKLNVGAHVTVRNNTGTGSNLAFTSQSRQGGSQ